MDRTGGHKKRRAVTVSFTRRDIETIERFLEERPCIHSRSELARNAVKFYLQQVELSGGIVDGHGFPVIPHLPPAVPSKPIWFRCETHDMYLLHGATCQLFESEASISHSSSSNRSPAIE